MNLSRLMVLGDLARHGPRHGHQIRRDAEMTNVSRWGGVSVGALYRELRQLEEDQLVEAVRTEQVGRRPARTIYRITEEGRRELSILRRKAILEMHSGPDALGVALMFGGVGEEGELAALLKSRRQALANVLDGITTKRTYLESKGYLSPSDAAVFRRAELHLQAELQWHDEFDPVLTEAAKQAPRTEPRKSTRRKRGKDAHD
jgi:DNA-binding PadR family transcriptional regulator